MRNVLTRIYIVPYTCITIHNDMNPTLATHKTKYKVIDTTVEDDDHKIFPMEITYEYSDYYGLGWEISVWNLDYKINGKPRISAVDLNNWIKDSIRENEEPTHVTFY